MTPVLVVAVLAAGLGGALLRYGASLAFAMRPGFPWAVLAVNAGGSAIGGIVLALVDRSVLSNDLRLVVLTGLAGGLTTFSTWSVETIQLIRTGRTGTAFASVTANLVLGLGVAVAAYSLVTALT